MIHINFIISLGLILTSCSAASRDVSQNPPSHILWDELLKKHVDSNGMVNYKGFLNDRNKFDQYLELLSHNAPDKLKWSREEQIAYWINAYNAFTIRLIVDNYPLSSIRELNPVVYIPGVNTVWHKKFFKIGDKETSLDKIEHGILRKEFQEPRIHFAINCASFSCPPLRNEAYVAEKLDKQLHEMASRFINDQKRNHITANRTEVSKIFSWFTNDFTSKGTLREYLNKYSINKIKADAVITYMEYDWSLNEIKAN